MRTFKLRDQFSEIVGVKEGDFVLVTGGGPLGAMQALLAKANGAKRVALTGSSAAKIEAAGWP